MCLADKVSGIIKITLQGWPLQRKGSGAGSIFKKITEIKVPIPNAKIINIEMMIFFDIVLSKLTFTIHGIRI